jgi:hypothetical protein
VTSKICLETLVNGKNGHDANDNLNRVDNIEDSDCGGVLLAGAAVGSDDNPGCNSGYDATGDNLEDSNPFFLTDVSGIFFNWLYQDLLGTILDFHQALFRPSLEVQVGQSKHSVILRQELQQRSYSRREPQEQNIRKDLRMVQGTVPHHRTIQRKMQIWRKLLGH